METVSVSRTYDADAERVRGVFEDVTAFFDAAGFDVERDGDRLELTRRVAMTRFELNIELVEEEGTVLAYEQIAGPFEEMVARYLVELTAAGSRLTVETSFEASTSGVTSYLNGAAIRRQRRSELDAVESLLESNTVSDDREQFRTQSSQGAGSGRR